MQLDRSPFCFNNSAREMAADISLGDLSGCRLSSGLLSGGSDATPESISGHTHPGHSIRPATTRQTARDYQHFEGGGLMANPQWEDGFVKIATEVFERLCRIRIPGEVRQVVDVVIRKTWGFNKKWDWIPLSQFCELTGIPKPHIIRALHKAEQMNLITKKGNSVAQKGNEVGVSYCFNKNYEEWKPLPKKVTLPKKVMDVAQKGNEPLPKKAPSIDNTKDTSSKDTSAGKPPAGSKKKKPKQTNPDIKKFIDAWSEEYLTKRKTKYLVAGGKDAAQVKRLLGSIPYDEAWETAQRFIEYKSDSFVGGLSKQIAVFVSQYNAIHQEFEGVGARKQLTSEKDYGPEGDRPF